MNIQYTRPNTGRNALACALLGLIAAGCGISSPQPQIPEPGSDGRFVLRVALYPWVPAGSALMDWVERDFEALHPDIDLVVRPLARAFDSQPEYVGDLAYEVDKAAAALTGDGPDAQHLVEIDTMLLGALIERGAVARFALDGPAFLPEALAAVTWEGAVWAVPHWLCGYFVISENPRIRQASDIDSLLAALTPTRPGQARLVGNLSDSWGVVMVYVDAFVDTYPKGDVAAALAAPALDPAVARSLRALGQACNHDGASQCGEDATARFATGGARGLIGYSERLAAILANEDRTVGALSVVSAPLGAGDRPTMFTDALVLSPRCQRPRCADAARAFARYYVSDRVFEVLLMGRDTEAQIPRYLLPSTDTAFALDSVAADPLYQQLEGEIRGATPYPNRGVPAARARGIIGRAVRAALGLPDEAEAEAEQQASD